MVDNKSVWCYNTCIETDKQKKCEMEAQLGTLYRVVITEYEAGVQRLAPCDTKLFTTLESAEYYKAIWEEGGSHEWSWRGDITIFG